jgi:zinc/manganese transport system substrate-binding protein
MRSSDISRCLAALCSILVWSGPIAWATQPPIRVVVSFSILEDIVHEVGGSDVAVTSLIGRDANEHGFEPSPDQVRLLAQARRFVIDGLGLEGWVTRLTQSAQYRGPLVVATEGIEPIAATEEHGPACLAHPDDRVQHGRTEKRHAQELMRAVTET